MRQLCRDQGLAVLWTTHLLDEVTDDDELLILNRGRLVAQGQARRLAAGDADLGATFARLTAGEVPA